MCVFGMLKTDGRYPFICVHIRDEFFPRETLEIKIDSEGILSANDKNVKDATWMGLNVRNGSFVALTNVNNIASNGREKNRSRGLLVRDLLAGKSYNAVWDGTNQYEGFNILHYNLQDDWHPKFLSNRPQPKKFGLDSNFISNNSFQSYSFSPNQTPCVVSFANGKLNDEEQWPRVHVLRKQLRQLQKNINLMSLDDVVETLAEIISDTSKFSSEIMPAKFPSHCCVERELFLRGSMFLTPIKLQDIKYGSRAQTIVIKDNAGIVYYYYRTVENLQSQWTKFVVDFNEQEVKC